MEDSKSLEMFDKDGFPKCCPYGASINFPKEPLRKVHIGTEICQKCQLFGGFEGKTKILCKF